MRKNRAVALGIVGSLIVLGGVVMSVLFHLIVDVVAEGYRPDVQNGEWDSVKQTENNHIWAFGLIYVIPGVLVVVAALVQNKCMYVTSCIVGMIALLIMALFVLIGCVALFFLIVSYGSISEHCEDTMDGCVCNVESEGSTGPQSGETPFKECHYFSTMASLVMALFFFIIITWVLLLTSFIMAVYYSCRSETTQPGRVYAPVHEQQCAPPAYNFQQPPSQPIFLESGAQGYYEGPPSKV